MAQPDFHVDDRELQALSRDLQFKRPSQFKASQRYVFNEQAKATRLQAINNQIPRTFINRSSWVASSVLIDFAKGDIMQAEVGAKKRWKRNPSKDFLGLRQNELGESISAREGIPTFQSRISGLIEKNISRPLKYDRMGNVIEISGGNIVAKLRQIEKNQPRRFIRIKSGKYKKGFYRFNKKQTFTQNNKKHMHLQMIRDTTKSRVKLPRRQWLEPSWKRAVTQSTTARFYRRGFEKYAKP